MATRCFSPPLSFSPRSPTCVSYPVDIAHLPQITCDNGFCDLMGQGRDGTEDRGVTRLNRAGKRTFGESHNGIMDACSLSGNLHFIIASYDAAIADVVGNGIIEEDSVLGHDANVRPERDLGHLEPKDHMLWL